MDDKTLIRAIVYTILGLAVYTVIIHSFKVSYEIPGFIGPAVIGIVGYITGKKLLDKEKPGPPPPPPTEKKEEATK